jgi:hypothetical protein
MISKIAKYPVEAELGRGGFGVVYRAYDPDVGRPVAIKVLNAESDGELFKRFQAEVGTTGNLTHKNIVVVYESGNEQGVPYLVMELLSGRTLHDLIKTGETLPLLDKVRIMSQVAEGLKFAHQKNVIHRDVKPGNVMLLADGNVKIMDFGIARVTTRSTVVTRAGFLIGTVPYMAPEQFQSDGDGYGRADKQTDIFAYGVVYYELLTGKHPFRGEDNLYALVERIKIMEPEAINLQVPDCPEALELLIYRALAKDREVRYASFDELLLDSEAVLADLAEERATEVLRLVPSLIEAGDLDSAEEQLKEIAELDPGNREARQLRKTIQDEKERRRVAARLPALLDEGDKHLKERRFAQAVETLETAQRLARNDEVVEARLAEAQARLEGNRRAGQLVSEARRDQQKGQLGEAVQRLRSALDFDFEHTDARALLSRLESELERREKERRLQQVISAASEHLAGKRYAQALNALDDLAADPARVAELRVRIERERAEEERRQAVDRFNLAVSGIREALQAHELSRATELLDAFSAEFAGMPDTTQVLPELRAELDAQVRSDAIAAYSQHVDSERQRGDFSKAEELLTGLIQQGSFDDRVTQMLADVRQHQRTDRDKQEAARDQREQEPVRELPTLKADVESGIEQEKQRSEQHEETIETGTPVGRQTVTADVPAPRQFRWRGMAVAGGVLAAIVATFLVMWHKPGAVKTAIVPVEIHSDPPGASVSFGDRSCIAPNCRFDLAPGRYQVQAQLTGYQPSQQTVTVDPSVVPTRVEFILDPIPPPAPIAAEKAVSGTMTVQAGMPNVLIFVDDAPRGRTDSTGVFSLPLEAKVHDVRVEKSGYETPKAQRVRIAEGRSQPVVFSLAPQSARLELRGAPAGVEVRVGGTVLGRTDGGTFSAPVRPGNQTLQVTNGTANRQLAQNFEPGQALTLDWKLIAPSNPLAQPAQPNGPAPPSPAAIEARDWDLARSGDSGQVQAYLDKHPNGAHTAEAQSRLDDLFWTGTNNPQEYLNRFPRGAHAAEASQHIADAAWNRIDKNDGTALRTFLAQNPSNPHRADAQTLLDQMEKQRADAEDRLKQERTKQEVSQKQRDVQNAQVIAILNRFNAAFEHKQQRELRAVWPDATKNYLDAVTTPHAGLRLEGPQVDVAGDRATVLCNVVSESSQSRTSPRPVKVTLQQRGGDWIIVSLEANR